MKSEVRNIDKKVSNEEFVKSKYPQAFAKRWWYNTKGGTVHYYGILYGNGLNYLATALTKAKAWKEAKLFIENGISETTFLKPKF